MRRIIIFSSIAVLLMGTTAWAGSLTVPHTFTSGQKAYAAEVNGNFDEVEREVTDNASNISSNAASITVIKGELPNINALTLEGMSANDFADSLHSHPGSPVGIHWITSLEFRSTYPGSMIGPNYISFDSSNTFWPAAAWAPIQLPFKCTITEMQFRARDNSDSGDVSVGINDGTEDSTGEYIPIVSKDTSAWASTRTYSIFTTGTISLLYDPTNFNNGRPLWIEAWLGDDHDVMRLRWIKLYYTVP